MNTNQEDQDDPIEDPEEDLFEHHHIVVDKGQQALRIDKFLINRIEKVSRNKVQKAIDAGNVLVGGKPVKSSFKIKPNQEISVVFPHPPREYELIPQKMDLDIIYEDDDLLLLNKAPGLVVHPGVGNFEGTLVHGLVHYLKDMPGTDMDPTRPGLVHRLDKDTSGLMVIAKSELSMSHLAKQFFNRTVKRSYQSLVWGEFDEQEGRIEGNIGRHPRFRKLMAVLPDEEGKRAITHYKVLEEFAYVSLIECRLETGRTHQIRVHMKHVGHPVFNDITYGGDRIIKGTPHTKYRQFINNCFKILPRQALHAKSLGFEHPRTGEEMFFESELPDDMTALLDKWRNYFTYLKSF